MVNAPDSRRVLLRPHEIRWPHRPRGFKSLPVRHFFNTSVGLRNDQGVITIQFQAHKPFYIFVGVASITASVVFMAVSAAYTGGAIYATVNLPFPLA